MMKKIIEKFKSFGKWVLLIIGSIGIFAGTISAIIFSIFNIQNKKQMEDKYEELNELKGKDKKLNEEINNIISDLNQLYDGKLPRKNTKSIK